MSLRNEGLFFARIAFKQNIAKKPVQSKRGESAALFLYIILIYKDCIISKLKLTLNKSPSIYISNFPP